MTTPRSEGQRSLARLAFRERSGLLSPDYAAILDDLVPNQWRVTERENLLDEMLARLDDFVDKEGHAVVPQSVPILGPWVQNQRSTYKKGNLAAVRIAELEKRRGWLWEVQQPAFVRALQSLDVFIEQHGHPNVPLDYVTTLPDGSTHNLGIWVIATKQQHTKGKLKADRVDELERRKGWKWAVPFEDKFYDGLAAFDAYVLEHGTGLVPATYVQDGFRLGAWVNATRVKRREGKLDPARIEAIESRRAWVWSSHDSKFQEKADETASYVREHGTSSIPVKKDEHYSLATWVNNTRAQYRAGKLSADRIRMMEAIDGWEWKPRRR